MKNFWNETPIWLKIVVMVILAIIAFVVGRKLVVYYKKVQAENLLSSTLATGSVNGQPFSVDYGSISQRIYAAFYENDWLGWTEDEEGAIIALTDCPKAFIPQLKDAYFKLYSKNLNADFTKYLSTASYSRVQNLLS